MKSNTFTSEDRLRILKDRQDYLESKISGDPDHPHFYARREAECLSWAIETLSQMVEP